MKTVAGTLIIPRGRRGDLRSRRGWAIINLARANRYGDPAGHHAARNVGSGSICARNDLQTRARSPPGYPAGPTLAASTPAPTFLLKPSKTRAAVTAQALSRPAASQIALWIDDNDGYDSMGQPELARAYFPTPWKIADLMRQPALGHPQLLRGAASGATEAAGKQHPQRAVPPAQHQSTRVHALIPYPASTSWAQ